MRGQQSVVLSRSGVNRSRDQASAQPNGLAGMTSGACSHAGLRVRPIRARKWQPTSIAGAIQGGIVHTFRSSSQREDHLKGKPQSGLPLPNTGAVMMMFEKHIDTKAVHCLTKHGNKFDVFMFLGSVNIPSGLLEWPLPESNLLIHHTKTPKFHHPPSLPMFHSCHLRPWEVPPPQPQSLTMTNHLNSNC